MDREEPNAASIIAQALNKGNEIAMRTTELTAMSVLKGELIVQLGKDISQRVAFQTVRDRVRHELDMAAEDPDLPEVYDFLVSLGAGQNSYIDDFLEFGERLVDSKKRQLRFAAFASANSISEKFPWTKVAIMKRAYRNKPSNGYCANPETQWKDICHAKVETLEELLRFFHVGCEEYMKVLSPQSRIKGLANLDIAAASTFYAAADEKKKCTTDKIRKQLLDATATYLEPLGIKETNLPSPKAEWIKFGTPAKEPPPPTEPESAPVPIVVEYDERTGRQITTQVSLEKVTLPVEEKQWKLPWREWAKNDKNMGSLVADKAAAVAVLHTLHQHIPIESEWVEIWDKKGGQCVVTTGAVKSEAILLPPCVPKLRPRSHCVP